MNDNRIDWLIRKITRGMLTLLMIGIVAWLLVENPDITENISRVFQNIFSAAMAID